MASMRRKILPSDTRWATSARSFSWSTDPKKSFRSASTIHSLPASISFQTLRRASFVDRPRRYPKFGVIKHRLEDRLQAIEQGLLTYPIEDRRDSQHAPLTRFTRLRDAHLPYGLG